MPAADPRPRSSISRWLETAPPAAFATYCIAAAFWTYFCMYAFRKPFTAGEFADESLWDVGYKPVLIASQVAGYTLSKFIGIKVISEMPRGRRALWIVGLIAFAEVALVGFALTPAPYNFPFLFLNGLPLGMVFGLVLSFLEGRRFTETLSAGLCASFIVSSGVVKSVGRSLITDFEVNEYLMPALTGLVFAAPLLVSVYFLSRIPPPDAEDERARTPRAPMNASERWSFFRRHALGLSGLLAIFIALTFLRSLRDDFAVEIWRDMGKEEPSIFARSETLVMFAVVAICGATAWVRDNRRALLTSLALVFGGLLLTVVAAAGYSAGILTPFPFMVLIGVGMYVAYVAYHTTVFERLIASFRERANIGYLMYLADATGYLAYVAVLFYRSWFFSDGRFLELFLQALWGIGISSTVIAVLLIAYYSRRTPQSVAPAEELSTGASASEPAVG